MKNPLNHIKTLTDNWGKISLSFLPSFSWTVCQSISKRLSLSPSFCLRFNLSRSLSSLSFSSVSLSAIPPLEFNQEAWVSCEMVHDMQSVCVCACMQCVCAWCLHECIQCVCVCVCVPSWHPLGRESIPAGSSWFSICRPAYVREQTQPDWLHWLADWVNGCVTEWLTNWLSKQADLLAFKLADLTSWLVAGINF